MSRKTIGGSKVSEYCMNNYLKSAMLSTIYHAIVAELINMSTLANSV